MTENDITSLIDSHIVQSERLRARALLIIAFLLVIVNIAVWLSPGATPTTDRHAWDSALGMLAATLLALSTYVGIVLVRLRHWQRQSSPVPMKFRYFNTIAEILVPSFMIWNWSHIAGPLQTLGGVLPWLYFPFIAVSALHLHQRLCWLAGLASALCFYVVALMITPDQSKAEASMLTSQTSFVLKSFMMIVCGAVAGFVAEQLRSNIVNAIRSARERDRAVGIFGQHVSPQVARRLIEQPAELNAELRHVCVMFLDIRGFSTMSSQRSPSEVMDYLNVLFTPMITIVNQHGGIVNKFLGDGFMAIFGAPFEDPQLHRNAIQCSHALVDCVTKLNSSGGIPLTRIGIGIHAGEAMAGTVGSDERREYTLLGDTVNAAARIEQETKKHEAQIIVSGALYDALNPLDNHAIDLGEIDLRGIHKPVRLYRLA